MIKRKLKKNLLQVFVIIFSFMPLYSMEREENNNVEQLNEQNNREILSLKDLVILYIVKQAKALEKTDKKLPEDFEERIISLLGMSEVISLVVPQVFCVPSYIVPRMRGSNGSMSFNNIFIPKRSVDGSKYFTCYDSVKNIMYHYQYDDEKKQWVSNKYSIDGTVVRLLWTPTGRFFVIIKKNIIELYEYNIKEKKLIMHDKFERNADCLSHNIFSCNPCEDCFVFVDNKDAVNICSYKDGQWHKQQLKLPLKIKYFEFKWSSNGQFLSVHDWSRMVIFSKNENDIWECSQSYSKVDNSCTAQIVEWNKKPDTCSFMRKSTDGNIYNYSFDNNHRKWSSVKLNVDDAVEISAFDYYGEHIILSLGAKFYVYELHNDKWVRTYVGEEGIHPKISDNGKFIGCITHEDDERVAKVCIKDSTTNAWNKTTFNPPMIGNKLNFIDKDFVIVSSELDSFCCAYNNETGKWESRRAGSEISFLERSDETLFVSDNQQEQYSPYLCRYLLKSVMVHKLYVPKSQESDLCLGLRWDPQGQYIIGTTIENKEPIAKESKLLIWDCDLFKNCSLKSLSLLSRIVDQKQPRDSNGYVILPEEYEKDYHALPATMRNRLAVNQKSDSWFMSINNFLMNYWSF